MKSLQMSQNYCLLGLHRKALEEEEEEEEEEKEKEKEELNVGEQEGELCWEVGRRTLLF